MLTGILQCYEWCCSIHVKCRNGLATALTVICIHVCNNEQRLQGTFSVYGSKHYVYYAHVVEGTCELLAVTLLFTTGCARLYSVAVDA
jgi:hypothetical protein